MAVVEHVFGRGVEERRSAKRATSRSVSGEEELVTAPRDEVLVGKQHSFVATDHQQADGGKLLLPVIGATQQIADFGLPRRQPPGQRAFVAELEELYKKTINR